MLTPAASSALLPVELQPYGVVDLQDVVTPAHKPCADARALQHRGNSSLSPMCRRPTFSCTTLPSVLPFFSFCTSGSSTSDSTCSGQGDCSGL